MEDYREYFEENRKLWNRRTAVHKDSEFYDVASFLGGKSSLQSIELKELSDVSGKKILHLQCHFGLDTLSLARMDATVTCVDLSDDAIAEARRLSEISGMGARFICCNVYDLPEHLDEKFDLVFTSYGVIGWLPDLDLWAKMIAGYLNEGGRFYMAEFHPVVWMLDEDFNGVKYYYDNREMIVVQSQGTYTDRDADIKHVEYSWNHGLGEVVNALLRSGMRIDFLNEYSYSPYNCFNRMVKGEDGNWRVEGLEDKVPMVYSVGATKG